MRRCDVRIREWVDADAVAVAKSADDKTWIYL